MTSACSLEGFRRSIKLRQRLCLIFSAVLLIMIVRDGCAELSVTHVDMDRKT